MRVQRAPRAADQPQPAPTGGAVVRPRVAPAPTAEAAPAAPGFSAGVDLDLTGLLTRLDDEAQGAAEVIVRLVAAFRHERLIDDESALRVVRLTDRGLVGVQLEQAVNQSAYAISSALGFSSVALPATAPGTLTVVHLAGTRVEAVGDWGSAGLGVATLGRIVPTVRCAPTHGLSITQRSVARLGCTVPSSSAAAQAVVRALDRVARSVEGLD